MFLACCVVAGGPLLGDCPVVRKMGGWPMVRRAEAVENPNSGLRLIRYAWGPVDAQTGQIVTGSAARATDDCYRRAAEQHRPGARLPTLRSRRDRRPLLR